MLGTVLSRMIPMLGACKHENMQWVFAYGEFPLVVCCAFVMCICDVTLKT